MGKMLCNKRVLKGMMCMKKSFYIIIAALIICLLSLIIVLLVYINSNKKSTSNEEFITVPGKQLSFELNNKIFPQDYLEFQQKTKNLQLNYDDIYKAIYKFAKEGNRIYKYTVDLPDADLKKYYSNNLVELKLKGIQSADDFVKIVPSIREVFSGKDVYYSNVVIKVNDEAKKDYEIVIEYNNDKFITLGLVIDTTAKTFKFVAK